jgi:hypothetical protein
MLITEMLSNDTPEFWYQDVEDDNSTLSFKDTRKTKLTLAQIRKLRQMADIRAFERAQYIQRVRVQYATKSEG